MDSPDEGHTDSEAGPEGCLLRTVAGPRLHGLEIESDDPQELAIVIPPLGTVAGLDDLDWWAARSAGNEQSAHPGSPSLTVRTLATHCRLAMAGDTDAFLPLFAPEEMTLKCTEQGSQLRREARTFIAAGEVAWNARRRLDSFMGSASNGNPLADDLPPGAEARSPFHSAWQVMEAMRTGYQAIELLRHGRITLPVPDPERTRLLEVRSGNASLPAVLKEVERISQALSRAPIPCMEPPPDLIISQWAQQVHLDYWNGNWRPTFLE